MSIYKNNIRGIIIDMNYHRWDADIAGYLMWYPKRQYWSICNFDDPLSVNGATVDWLRPSGDVRHQLIDIVTRRLEAGIKDFSDIVVEYNRRGTVHAIDQSRTIIQSENEVERADSSALYLAMPLFGIF